MGLDMHAYAAAQAGAMNEYYRERYENGNESAVEPRELAYWRKHPNLHGWMEQLFRKKNPDSIASFNGDELELTWEDIDALERDIKKRQLPSTTGFFFGKDADQVYYQDDLEFVQKARTELFSGLKVFYNSSW